MQSIIDILGNIGFDWKVALANLVNFLIIFYLLKRFAFPKIDAVLKKRKDTIKEGLDNATRAETELQKATQLREEKLDEAKGEAHEILAGAHMEEKAIVSAAVEKAQRAADKEHQAGQARIQHDKQEMEYVFKEEAAELVLRGVEKVMRSEMNKEKNERFIQEILAK